MNRTKIIIGVIFSILVILYLINFVVYKAVLLVFGISGSSFLVMGILGLLGASIIAAIILGMRYYNSFVRTYYLFSMIWMGFLGYFFIASALYILISAYAGSQLKFFGIALFCLAAIVGIYGLIHARKFIIKEIAIKLPGLPDIWRERKAVWISDLHLGQIYGKKSMEKVVQKIKNISPDIVFIGGDLFDGSALPEILGFIAPLQELSIPLGIYFVAGNHEEFGDNSKFLDAVKSANIRVLQDEKILIDGVQIIGVDYRNALNKNGFEKILSDFNIDKNTASILLKHEPRDVDVAEKAGVSLQISGHTHKAQQWPFGYLTQLVYERFAYGLNKFGNMQVYTSSGAGTWGPPMRVGTDCEIAVFTFINI
jgi:hypothetical protein